MLLGVRERINTFINGKLNSIEEVKYHVKDMSQKEKNTIFLLAHTTMYLKRYIIAPTVGWFVFIGVAGMVSRSGVVHAHWSSFLELLISYFLVSSGIRYTVASIVEHRKSQE
jgi:hypothetical protein